MAKSLNESRFIAALFVIAILIGPVGWAANTITIGDVDITIPDQPGFVLVTEDMGPMYEAGKDLLYPGNILLGNFVPEDVIPEILDRTPVDFDRHFSLQTHGQTANSTFSEVDFIAMRAALDQQISQSRSMIMEKVPGELAKATDRLEKTLDLELAFSLTNVVPLAPHLNTDDQFAFSMYLSVEIGSDVGSGERDIRASTTTLLWVRGKVFYIYVYGMRDDLEWSRAYSKELAEQIIAAN